MKYTKNIPILIFILTMLVAGCGDSLLNPVSPPDDKNPFSSPGGPASFGLVEVTISGIGTGQMSASARAVQPPIAFNLEKPNSNNRALIFDGTDEYATANAPLLGTALTLSAWIKPEASGAAPIIEFETGADLGVHLWQFPDSNDLLINVVDNAGNSHALTAVNALTQGVWQQITAVYDGSTGTGTLYVNGVQVARQNLGAFTPATGGSLFIGHRDADSRFYHGTIDEVRIWNTARTQADIQSDMNTQINPATAGLVSYYRFNEGTGTTTEDLAGSNDATLFSGAGWASGAPINGSITGDGTIQFKPVSNGSFTYGSRDAGGMRYLFATFNVRNAAATGTPVYGDARHNLTFLAVDTDASFGNNETFGHTAVTELRLFDGTELSGTKAADLSAATIPTGRVTIGMNNQIISVHPDVLQVFTENEIQVFEGSLPPGSEVTDIFPYGFMVRSPHVTPGSRMLPGLTGDSRPPEEQFDGVITFAFKIPLQAQANKDPFEISVMFLPVDDSQTRITRSIQEALYGGSTSFELRAMQLDASNVTLLGNSDYNGFSPAQTLCDTRIAGTILSPVTTLNAGAGCTPEQFSNYFVDADATGSGNGLSWEDAFTKLQDALAAAQPGEPIWVAEGAYYPDKGVGQTANDRTSTFQLKNGVAIFGGFDPSVSDDTFNERDSQTNVTILSGDLTQNDGTDFANNGENAYHVVTGSGTDNTAVLNGFTITGGNVNEPPFKGGGVFNDSGSPTLTNITISGNAADLGGGIYNAFNSSPILTNMTISGNTAVLGGGVYNLDSTPVLTNVKITGNEATIKGAGIYNNDSSPVLTNVSIVGNELDGIYNLNSSPTLINVTISGNTNFGIRNDGSSPKIRNSIIWGNTIASISNDDLSSPIITNSIIEGGCPPGAAGSECTNVSSSDPLFTDGDGADNTYGTADDDFTLQSGSPAIDAGNNTFLPDDTYDLDGDGNVTELIPLDLVGNTRIINSSVDQGAYEKQ